MAAGVIIYEVPMLALAFLLISFNGFSLFFLWRFTRQIQADLLHLAVHVRNSRKVDEPGEYK